MEKDTDFAKLLLPCEVYLHFELTDCVVNDTQADLFLDEKAVPPQPNDYVSKGMTEQRVIQDFPLRGKPVFLHIRRRKWQVRQTGKLFSQPFDLTYKGTRLTKELAAFLKETNRE